MPYASTRFCDLTHAHVGAYRRAWRRHLERVLADFPPDLIHVHHVWLLGALVKDVAPEVPVVTHCHATGLRQMELCPHLRAEVCAGCARNDRFVVLTARHADALVDSARGCPRAWACVRRRPLGLHLACGLPARRGGVGRNPPLMPPGRCRGSITPGAWWPMADEIALCGPGAPDGLRFHSNVAPFRYAVRRAVWVMAVITAQPVGDVNPAR